MGDYRSYRTVRRRSRRDPGPQRIADVLAEVLVRYSQFEPEPAAHDRPPEPTDAARPTRQLELFQSLGGVG